MLLCAKVVLVFMVLCQFLHMLCCLRSLEDFKNVLLINVVGTFAVTQAFLPLLKAGHKKTIVHTSSIAASLTTSRSFAQQKLPTDASLGLSYRASKVAVNMGELNLAAIHH